MKRRLTRNVILMAIVTLIMGIGLSLYIASTGTVPAADNAASYTDGTYTASAHGCLSDVAVTVTITGSSGDTLILPLIVPGGAARISTTHLWLQLLRAL